MLRKQIRCPCVAKRNSEIYKHLTCDGCHGFCGARAQLRRKQAIPQVKGTETLFTWENTGSMYKRKHHRCGSSVIRETEEWLRAAGEGNEQSRHTGETQSRVLHHILIHLNILHFKYIANNWRKDSHVRITITAYFFHNINVHTLICTRLEPRSSGLPVCVELFTVVDTLTWAYSDSCWCPPCCIGAEAGPGLHLEKSISP